MQSQTFVLISFLALLLAACQSSDLATPTLAPPSRLAPATTLAPTATLAPPLPTASLPPASDTPPPSPTDTPVPTATPTLGPGSTRAAAADGMLQVFVPAGEFSMGSTSDDPLAYDDEQPRHTVYLDAYWIDATEVTIASFAAFVAATGYETAAERAGTGQVFSLQTQAWQTVPGADWQHPAGPGSTVAVLDDHPVGQISWSDAVAYCEWAGRRLPTEAEWEKAARGTDARAYPWGDTPPAGHLLNFADRSLSVDWADPDADDGAQFAAPVGTYPDGASPYGALDLAGNAWEWVADFSDPAYYAASPYANPPGPASGEEHVLRGGSWWAAARDVRSTVRDSVVDIPYDIYGFRCAQSAP